MIVKNNLILTIVNIIFSIISIGLYFMFAMCTENQQSLIVDIGYGLFQLVVTFLVFFFAGKIMSSLFEKSIDYKKIRNRISVIYLVLSIIISTICWFISEKYQLEIFVLFNTFPILQIGYTVLDKLIIFSKNLYEIEFDVWIIMIIENFLKVLCWFIGAKRKTKII